MKIIISTHNNVNGFIELVLLSTYQVESKDNVIQNIGSGQIYRIMDQNSPIVKVCRNQYLRIDDVQSNCDDLGWVPKEWIGTGFGNYQFS